MQNQCRGLMLRAALRRDNNPPYRHRNRQVARCLVLRIKQTGNNSTTQANPNEKEEVVVDDL